MEIFKNIECEYKFVFKNIFMEGSDQDQRGLHLHLHWLKLTIALQGKKYKKLIYLEHQKN